MSVFLQIWQSKNTVKWYLQKMYGINYPAEKLRKNTLLVSNKQRFIEEFFGRKPKNNEKTFETEIHNDGNKLR
ncbi:hypothetical protein E4G67_02155 [Candidatus Bathyarchaeota archaeon]|nr:MAG: hypothetical protein E4G67_02155 [Candidatus Bathyarchaeota archaeon]